MAGAKVVSDTKEFGRALQEVPLHDLFKSLALSVVDAQSNLDENAIRQVRKMADTSVSMLNSDGIRVSRSLLELGFQPSFYHFSEAKVEASVTVSMRKQEASSFGLGLKVGADFSTTETT